MSGASVPVFGRFLISGVANTLLTYGFYLALLQVLSYLPAYVIAFVVGIVIAYWFNRLFVFRTKGRSRTALLFPFVYVIQLGTGALTAVIWVDVLQLPRELAAAAAIVMTVPLTFILTRLLFVERV